MVCLPEPFNTRVNGCPLPPHRPGHDPLALSESHWAVRLLSASRFDNESHPSLLLFPGSVKVLFAVRRERARLASERFKEGSRTKAQPREVGKDSRTSR